MSPISLFEMERRIDHYFMWAIVVNCLLVHADIGGVNVGLRYQLHRCVCKSSSLQNCLIQQHSCLKSSLLQCLLFHEPLADFHVEMRRLCGVINTGRHLMSHTWYIAVSSTFSLYIDFLHFYLPMSPNCKHGTRVRLQTAESTIRTYCGRRVPWYLSFPQSYAILSVSASGQYNTLEGFLFRYDISGV